ncbi:MAG: FAD-dependent oxidoreductase [Pseudomonadota bacterium]
MKVIVVGSGIGGESFAAKFRLLSPNAEVTLLTRETFGYYSRPLLSNGFTRENIEHKIVLRSFDDLRKDGIQLHDGVDVSAVDRANKTVLVRCGDRVETKPYDKLVLALGSSALIPRPFQPHRDLFFVLNSLADLKLLRRHRQSILDAGATPRWAIIGGGLIGCEVASDLSAVGDSVEVFHAMPKLMERQLAEDDSDTLFEVLKASGVSVCLDAEVQGFADTGSKRSVTTAEGEIGGFDGIIVACGFKPRTGLAETAGLAVGRGVVVDGCMRTGDPDIFAVGDVAQCPDGKIYAYILPIRSQALWLANHLSESTTEPWKLPPFKPKAKVHGFEAAHPYKF